MLSKADMPARTQYQRAKSAVSQAAGDLGPVLVAALLVAPVVAAGLFYVWTRVATLRLGYELSRAGAVHRTLIEQNRGLRIEAASLKAPDRLARLGREKYHLEPPRPSQVVRLEASAKPVGKDQK
jgi:hypothetical protein